MNFQKSNSILSNSHSKQNKESRTDWIVIACFVVFLGALLLAHAGKILSVLFPVISVVVACFLCQRNPVLYIGFTWWSWFLGILIRRMIDFYAGEYTYGPWHLTPMLVTSVSIITLLNRIPNGRKNGDANLIILMPILSLVYCAAITYIQDSSRLVILGTLSWMSPISFCFYISDHWRNYPKIRDSIQFNFLWGPTLMSIYGIYQYIVAPGWDCFYLENPLTTKAFGLPEPFGIRVFSTMDAPHILGAILSAGLIIILAAKEKPYKPISLVLASLTILLTSARTIWFSLCISLLIFFPALSSNRKIKFLLYVVITIIGVYLLAMSEPFYDLITKRFETLSNSDEDISYTMRKDALTYVGFSALFEFVGKGFGASSLVFNGVPAGDNGIFLMLFTLGLIGSIPYFLSFSILLISLFKVPDYRADIFLKASRAIVVSTSFQIGFVPVLESGFAMVLWGFLGFGLASLKYNTYIYNLHEKSTEN
jgi:hypothetical protein